MIRDPLILPSDVVIVPVEQLAESVRARLDAEPDSFAVTRPGLRTPSRLVDRDGAALLAEFRQPIRIVDAVLRFSRERGSDPQTTLDEAFPLLRSMVSSNVLVAADAEDSTGLVATLDVGHAIGEWRVVRPVQVLEDSEVYELRRDSVSESRASESQAGESTAAEIEAAEDRAALKILRPGANPALGPFLAREAEVLAALDGRSAPRLLGQGRHDDRPYLLLEWCAGAPVLDVAQTWRAAGQDARGRLGRLAVAVVRAYAALHAAGFCHGDVHPRNVLVESTGDDEAPSVRLVDFGFARALAPEHPLGTVPRAGVAGYFEPVYAAALLDDRDAPPIEPLAEQYSLAVLVDEIFTGVPYLEPPAERAAFLSHLIEAPPRAFAERGAPPRPEVEAVLRRALAKEPDRRFASLDAFADALDAARRDESADRSDEARPWGRRANAFVQRCLRSVLPGGALDLGGLPHRPRASVNLGAAGIAYCLYRLACVRDDPELLAQADVWAQRAFRAVGEAGDFFDETSGMTPEIVETVSTHHHLPGLHVVQALVGSAMGVRHVADDHVDAFIGASRLEWSQPDLTLGRSGTLLGAALLLEALPPGGARQPLEAFTVEARDALWARHADSGPIATCRDFPGLGIAHGWAGLLYVVARASRAVGAAPPEGWAGRLDELAAFAVDAGRGVSWPGSVPLPDLPSRFLEHAPGWCSGSAGYVHLWLLAHRELGDERWARLAERCGHFAAEATSAGGDLCCGAAGRAYACLALYQATGESGWRRRANQLTRSAIATPADRWLHDASLYRGRFGAALLAAELEHPETASMPFFASEGGAEAMDR